MFRTSSIQSRLLHRYGGMLHFEKHSNNEGIFVGLSDPSVYIRRAMSKPTIWQRPDTPDPHRKKQLCERFISMKYDESSLVKYRQPDVFKNMFICPGDFHLMKNMMIVVWDLLKGSGIEDVLKSIYKNATFSSILVVRHFNRSLGCCKRLHTALHMLCIEAFSHQTSISSSITDCLNTLKSVILQIPSEYASDDIFQKWFPQLLQTVKQSHFQTYVHAWAFNFSRTNSTSRLWYFILHRILLPIPQLYMAIRRCNFDARNAASTIWKTPLSPIKSRTRATNRPRKNSGMKQKYN
ncbi:unnamed protein product [Rotaria socialis]|uniref:Uncharacterized protein n=1 Tax=Rotaria socialis TaxID=392032 RepID=A0A821DA88_9BILA|nr:unnamed protein product [Rotaria socialis]CAF4429359.1 unnamed protein product [Rotaria socialis]CAF4617643.1 unnamed protein product [Rotaria socialis]